MSRNGIDRLTRRVEALEAQRKARARRFFRVVVRDHRRRDEEVARFRAEHGVTSDDILFVRCFVPYECRPGETAAEAYERELREMASKTQEALDHGERPVQELREGSGTETIATASTPPSAGR